MPDEGSESTCGSGVMGLRSELFGRAPDGNIPVPHTAIARTAVAFGDHSGARETRDDGLTIGNRQKGFAVKPDLLKSSLCSWPFLLPLGRRSGHTAISSLIGSRTVVFLRGEISRLVTLYSLSLIVTMFRLAFANVGNLLTCEE